MTTRRSPEVTFAISRTLKVNDIGLFKVSNVMFLYVFLISIIKNPDVPLFVVWIVEFFDLTLIFF